MQHISTVQYQGGYRSDAGLLGIPDPLRGLPQVDHLHIYFAFVYQVQNVLFGAYAYGATGVIKNCFFMAILGFS